MSHSSRTAAFAQAVLDAAEEAVSFSPSTDCSRVIVSIQAASSLVGCTLVGEVQLGGAAGPWTVVGMALSNRTDNTAQVAVTATLTAVPAYHLIADIPAGATFRVRASALSSGTVTVRVSPGN